LGADIDADTMLVGALLLIDGKECEWDKLNDDKSKVIACDEIILLRCIVFDIKITQIQ
jgi:hypothetical protein